MEIYVYRGAESLGTFTLKETTRYLSEGRLVDTDMVWYAGLDDWRQLGEVRDQLTSLEPPAEFDGTQSIPPETLFIGKSSAGDGQEVRDPGPVGSLSDLGQGRYQRRKFLGQGAMGQVWLAYDQQLEREVALKMLHQGRATEQGALRELKEEVQKCLELTHTNIIRIYDLVEPPGEDSFISMEYVSGEDLYEKLKHHRGGRFEWREIEAYALSLCEALEYAHDQGMVHRDLKPQNLMVTKENELKLADFGIAAPARVEEETDLPNMDESTIGQAVVSTPVVRSGTPVYWSPQQAQGLMPEATDDIYSLGTTLYHLLVGKPPFEGASEPEITRQHVEDEPLHPQQKLGKLGAEGKIPGYVSDLILKCLAKRPGERFQGTGEVRAWIKAKGDPLVRKQKRMAMVASAMGVVALVMGVLAIWAFNQRSVAEEQRGIARTKQLQAERAREGEAEQRKKAETELKKAQAVSEFVGGIFSAVEPGELKNVSDEDKDLLKLVLAKGAEKIDELEDQPEVEANIRYILGGAYYSLGFYDEALVHYERALVLRSEIYGSDSDIVGRDLNDLGVVYLSKGDIDKALVCFQKSLVVGQSKLGPDHPYVGKRLNNLGMLLHRKGDLTGALENLEKANTIFLKHLGLDHPNVAVSYNNIGDVLIDKGEPDQALVYYQKALAIYQNKLGREHQSLNLTWCFQKIGTVYDEKGEYEKALEFLQRALAVQLKQLGPEHPALTPVYTAIGNVYLNKGEHDKALEYHHKSLAITLKVNPGDLGIIAAYGNLGQAYIGKNEYDQALKYLQLGLDISLRKLGPEHLKVAALYDKLGILCVDNEEYDRAQEYSRNALSIALKKLGPDSHTVGIYYLHLAFAHLGKEELAEGKLFIEKAYAIFQIKLGAEHPHTKKAKMILDKLAKYQKK